MLSPDTPHPLTKISSGVTFLKNCITNPNILIGDYTYYDGRDRTEHFEKENVIFAFSCKLIIGKFCQIAYGTKFIMSDANHQMSGFSTYPFFVFGKWAEGCPEWENYPLDLSSKGDTIVGNDVWFGHESTVMAGVTIGDGAIIGAKAVVTKNVLPYTIVAGNPAKVTRRRFADDVIEKLCSLQWWNWDYEKITRNIPAITGGDIQKLLSAK